MEKQEEDAWTEQMHAAVNYAELLRCPPPPHTHTNPNPPPKSVRCVVLPSGFSFKV